MVRALSYVLGQQSSTVGLLFLPLWLIEGDAVMSETEMSSFGRGLQPSFTIDYRALGNIASLGRNTDKWFCGSYRDNVPDHYHIGYQIASYTYTKYNCNIWDQVAYYSVRNPYLIATTAVSLKKFYKTSVIKLTRETFNDLEKYWSTLPHVEDSSARIPVKAGKSYTTYEHPIWLDDGSILSLKTDLDRPTAWWRPMPPAVPKDASAIRATYRRGPRPTAGAYGGPNTAAARSSPNGSTRHCAT